MDCKSAEYKISQVKTEYLDEIKVYFIEVTSPDSFLKPFDFIVIKNFYTHTVNIVQYAQDKWKCVLAEFKLMSDPDCDEEAEKYSVIYRKQLEENGFSNQAEILRFYLTQESEHWNSFTLKEIKFVKDSEEKEGLKFNHTTSRFEFANVTLFNDREEINQNYIEIMQTNSSDVKLTLLK